jgi:hypothetical protein
MESAGHTVNGSYKTSNVAIECEQPALLQSANHGSEVRLGRRLIYISNHALVFYIIKA